MYPTSGLRKHGLLIRRDIGGACGILPTPQLARDERAEFRWAAAHGRHALLIEFCGNRRQVNDAIYFGVEPLDDLSRGAGSREQADPCHCLESRKATLRDTRQIRKMRIALGAAGRKRPQRSSIDLSK